MAAFIGAAIALWMLFRPAPEHQVPAQSEKSTVPPVIGSPAVSLDLPVESPVPAASPAPVPARPHTAATRASGPGNLTNPLVPSSSAESSGQPLDAAESLIASDLDQISLMLRDFRTLTGENPVGTNAEIMKAIMGGNPKGAMLGPPEGQSVNAGGELVDHWGSPYFFHQLTSDLMEIRSAGPDRILWNDDDIIGR